MVKTEQILQNTAIIIQWENPNLTMLLNIDAKIFVWTTLERGRYQIHIFIPMLWINAKTYLIEMKIFGEQ